MSLKMVPNNCKNFTNQDALSSIRFRIIFLPKGKNFRGAKTAKRVKKTQEARTLEVTCDIAEDKEDQ